MTMRFFIPVFLGWGLAFTSCAQGKETRVIGPEDAAKKGFSAEIKKADDKTAQVISCPLVLEVAFPKGYWFSPQEMGQVNRYQIIKGENSLQIDEKETPEKKLSSKDKENLAMDFEPGTVAFAPETVFPGNQEKKRGANEFVSKSAILPAAVFPNPAFKSGEEKYYLAIKLPNGQTVIIEVKPLDPKEADGVEVSMSGGRVKLGPLLLEISPNVGDDLNSSGIKYNAEVIMASRLVPMGGSLGFLDFEFKSTGDLTFSSTNNTSKEALNASMGARFLHYYALSDYPGLDPGQERPLPYMLDFNPLEFEASQSFDVVNYTGQLRAYAAVPYTDLVGKLFGNFGDPMEIYAGYTPALAIEDRVGNGSKFEHRVEFGARWRIPLLPEEKPWFSRLYVDLGVDAVYLPESGNLKSFFQSQVNFAVTESIIVFANYRLGQAAPKFEALNGFQFGTTIPLGAEKKPTTYTPLDSATN